MRKFNKSFCLFVGLPVIGLVATFSSLAADLDENLVIAQNAKTTESSAITSTSRGELNGFKGYRHHRTGYKKHTDGWWYPEAAFQPGAHADSTNVKPKKASQKAKKDDDKPWLIKNHVDFCSSKYKSYTSSDNSYQPFDGPRKQCVSRYYSSK